MTLDTLIMLVGTFVALLPFLGLPNSWDKVIFFLLGVFVIALGVIVRRRMGSHSMHSSGQTFVENVPSREADTQFTGGHEE